MRIIPVVSTKGGSGKTKICVNLGRSLHSRGFKIGFLDTDWVAPNVHVELGVKAEQVMKLSNSVGDVIKPVVSPEGFPLVSSAFMFPKDQAISMDEETEIGDILEVTRPGTVDWGPLDYLLMDTPPTTAKFVQAALKIPNLHGVVMVCQPASLALADVLRTVSMLREIQIPVCGLVGNQVYVICPHGDKVNLYDLSEDDLKKFCVSQGVIYLGSIPHIIPNGNINTVPLDGVVDRVIGMTPLPLEKIKVPTLPYKILVLLARRQHATK